VTPVRALTSGQRAELAAVAGRVADFLEARLDLTVEP
jgi:hypothetical protein